MRNISETKQQQMLNRNIVGSMARFVFILLSTRGAIPKYFDRDDCVIKNYYVCLCFNTLL